MSTQKTYQYDRLQSSFTIRLVTLTPGSAGEPLQCHIDMYNLEASPSYEAVSYVWGTSETRLPIQISSSDGNTELGITQNLAAALGRFRQTSSSRTLWIDSICINQEDDEERSQQVRIMGRIYQKASTVLIWLGNDINQGDTGRAATCMNLLAKVGTIQTQMPGWSSKPWIENSAQVNSFFGITRPTPDEINKRFDIPSLDSPEFEALRALLSNAWFSRAWTWQESFLARKRIFHCDSWYWPDTLMRKVFVTLLELRKFSGDSSYLHDDHYQIAPMVAGLDFWTRRKESPRNYMKLLPLLSVRRGSGCKLPSDLVYSLLGAAWERPDVEVDYKRPFETVFARVAEQIIGHEGDLSIFGMIETLRKESTLPTWVPNWRTRGATAGFSSIFQRRYAATGSSQPVVTLSGNARILSIHGLKLDRICAITSINSKEVEEWLDKRFSEVVEGKKVYRYTNETLEEAFRRVRCLDLTDFDPEQPVTRWKADSHEHFKRIQTHFSDGQEGRMRYAALLSSLLEKNRSKSLVVTEQGRLGMTPEVVQEGDIITLLLGGEVPIVLRPLGENGGYTLVGECYVHGFMDGEGLVIARQLVQPESDCGDTSWLRRLHEETLLKFPTEIFHIH